MIETAIIVGTAIVAGGATLSTMVYTVKEKQEALIERFGQYRKTVKSAGLKLKAPWHKVRRVPTDVRLWKEPLKTKTADDIFVTIPINMRVQIIDTQKFLYATNDPEGNIKVDVAAAVKQMGSGMQFADLFKEREKISHDVLEKVGAQILDQYGVRLLEVIVDEPQVTTELQASYDSRKASENRAVVRLNEARSEKEAAIMRAEGRKEELRLDGEGIAAQRKAIFENYAEQFNQLAAKGLTQEQAHQVITLAMANDTVRDAAKSGNVILTTTNAADTLAQMQALGKTLREPTPSKPVNENAPKAQPGIKG